MLVDEDDADVLPRLGERLEGALDGRRLGLVVNNEKVLLRLCAGCDMLFEKRVSSAWYRPRARLSVLTPMPARRRPVTES